jgi:large subunit ribosomal protein L17
MRHRKHHGSLGLVSGHRRALLANLASALITHGSIKTTHAKARAVRPYMEKLITLGKRGDLHARRQVLAKLRHRNIVDRLFDDVAPSYSDRPGGYTRIIKTGFRAGDAAQMAVIALVEEKMAAKPAKAKPKAEKKAEPKPVEKEEGVAKEAAAETVADNKPEAKAEEVPEAVTEEKAEAAPEEKAESAEAGGEAAEAASEGEEKVEAKADESSEAAEPEAGEVAPKDKETS